MFKIVWNKRSSLEKHSFVSVGYILAIFYKVQLATFKSNSKSNITSNNIIL